MPEGLGKEVIVLSELEQEALALFPMNEKKSIIWSKEMDKYRESVVNLRAKGFLQDVGMLNHPQSAFWVLKRVK